MVTESPSVCLSFKTKDDMSQDIETVSEESGGNWSLEQVYSFLTCEALGGTAAMQYGQEAEGWATVSW